MLSRLVRGEKRPKCTAAGECVRALWRALHGLLPALTASEYTIMPDHVHLLLLVDYDQDPAFNPLVFLHWFMEESGRMIAESNRGEQTPRLPVEMRRAYRSGGPGCGGGEPPSFAGLWDDRFWLDLSFDSRQLKAIRTYIRNNPLRYFWKADNPDMFVTRQHFRHPVLDPSYSWSACGDLSLLGNPFLLPVRLTRRKTVAEHEEEIAAVVGKAGQGWIPVSGFLSPGEKELYRRLRALPRARWIKTMAQGLPPRYDPSLEDSRFLAEHRALLLSALPIGAPFDWNACHLMNALAEGMGRRAWAR